MRNAMMMLHDAETVVSRVFGHHESEVGYLSYQIARQLGWDAVRSGRVFWTGLIHDIGALSLDEKFAALKEYPPEEVHAHAVRGAFLVRQYFPDPDVARMILYHHQAWENGACLAGHPDMLEDSNLLYLADRADAQIDRSSFILTQTDRIRAHIKEGRGSLYKSEFVDAFLKVTEKEYVWLNMMDDQFGWQIDDAYFKGRAPGMHDVENLAHLVSYLIDFKSSFTATHSSRVATNAEQIAKLMGFSAEDQEKIKIAGYLHDVGKLRVDNRILDKPGKLDKDEFGVIKSHPYFTYTFLKHLDSSEDIVLWASCHHERMDGSGYPFHLKGEQIPMGARIMAVADIMAALMEPRPYKKAMTKDAVLEILGRMRDEHKLDKNVVDTVIAHYDALASSCMASGELAQSWHDQFYQIL